MHTWALNVIFYSFIYLFIHLYILPHPFSHSQVAEITFNFWYKLSEVLYKKNCDNVNEQFKPYVERLIEALYRHCQMEPDHVSIFITNTYLLTALTLVADTPCKFIPLLFTSCIPLHSTYCS